MSQPIIDIKSGTTPAKKAAANLLPCRVNHSGSIDTVHPYWTPSQNEGAHHPPEAPGSLQTPF